MPFSALDFGLIIAYVVPGVIVLYGLSFISPRLRELWKGTGVAPTIGGAVLVMLIALVFGRVLSIVRIALMDSTFGVALPFTDCRQVPHRGAIMSVEPDYRQLIDGGRREAFKLAIANEQRPHQFAGNTAIAVLMATGCWIVSLNRGDRRRFRVFAACIGVGGLALVLYAGARASHYRFVRAIAAVNGQEVRSVDREGRPCQTADPVRP